MSLPPAIFLSPFLPVPHCSIALSFLVRESASFWEHSVHAPASEPFLGCSQACVAGPQSGYTSLGIPAPHSRFHQFLYLKENALLNNSAFPF